MSEQSHPPIPEWSEFFDVPGNLVGFRIPAFNHVTDEPFLAWPEVVRSRYWRRVAASVAEVEWRRQAARLGRKAQDRRVTFQGNQENAFAMNEAKANADAWREWGWWE